jgi:ankyrin repeat protein
MKSSALFPIDETTSLNRRTQAHDALAKACNVPSTPVHAPTQMQWVRGRLIETVHQKNNEMFFHAARTGQIELLELMFQRGVDVRTCNKLGETALHAASRAGHPLIINALLDRRADMEAEDHDGRHPIHCAIEAGAVEAIHALAENGANIHAIADLEINETELGHIAPIHFAALCGQPKSIFALIELGASVDSRDNAQRTPLFLAAASAPIETILTLLRHGADIRAQDQDGNAPLHFVAQHDLARTLDNMRDDVDERALSAIDVLLAHGADPLHVNQGGFRAFEQDGTLEELSRVDEWILSIRGGVQRSEPAKRRM